MGYSSGIGIGSQRPGVCTSTTKPASPFTGQVIYMTDTDETAVWDGTYWEGLNRSRDRNVVINGAMQVAQRGTSTASITTGGYYTADRFAIEINTLGTWTQSVEADAPTGSGFRSSLKMLCTTADASPAAADACSVLSKLEGQNLQQFLKGTASAKQFSLSFWVKGTTTGTYVAELFDVDNSRQVSAPYSISAANTWEKKTITFPADTTGAFGNDNGLSLGVLFWLGAGSNYTSGTLNTTWGAEVAANRAVGVTNLASATSKSWQVTGIQLEAGSVATPFEIEDYGTTLTKCQRYFETQDWSINTWRLAVVYATGATANGYFMYQPKRTTPSFSWSSNGSARYIYHNGNIGGSQTLSTSSSSYNGSSFSTSGTFAFSAGWVDQAGTLSISSEL
jgi:hypothetical protein